MQLHIVTAAAEEFTYSRNLIVNAPNLEFGQVAIDDFMGNNNQALDPGEMAIIRFPSSITAMLKPIISAALWWLAMFSTWQNPWM